MCIGHVKSGSWQRIQPVVVRVDADRNQQIEFWKPTAEPSKCEDAAEGSVTVFLSLLLLLVLTLLLGAAAVFTLLYYRDVELASWLHVMIGVVTMCVAFAFVLPVIADRFSVKTMSGVYQESCEQSTPIYVDKFLRPGFMYYAGKPGIEMVPQTNALSEALRSSQHINSD